MLRKAFLLLLLALFAMTAKYSCKRDRVLQVCSTELSSGLAAASTLLPQRKIGAYHVTIAYL